MSKRGIFSRDQPPSNPSIGGVIASVAVHAVGLGVLYLAGIYITGLGTSETRVPPGQRLTFVHVATPPDLVLKPVPRLKAPKLPRREPVRDPVPELRRAEIQPPTPQPPRVLPEPPQPTRPRATVNVGAFQNTVAHARAPEARRIVETSGFDTQSKQSQSPEMKLVDTTVGAFQSAAAADPRSSRTGRVADAGFGQAGPVPRQGPTARAIGDVGFGDTTNIERSTPTRAAQVQPTGFGAVEAPPARPAARTPERAHTSVEIIVKPTPQYTDEARAQKVEGEVLLEVEFRASGEVRVLRVVRGLGHGLDESAVRAAERIRFQPARSHQGPIDFRATVHIVFRLT